MSSKSLVPLIMGILIVSVTMHAFDREESTVAERFEDGSFTIETSNGSCGVEYLPGSSQLPLQSWYVDSLNMRLLGFYGIGPQSTRIALQDSYLYLAARWGFVVFDIGADSLHPPLVCGLTDLPCPVEGLAPYGDYLYVAHHTGGLCTYDISDPTTPILLDRYLLPEPKTAAWNSVVVNGAVCLEAFHPERDSNPQLVVCSLDDPAHPSEIARVEIPLAYNYYPIVDGNRLIIWGHPAHVYVIDLTNPWAPQIVDECELSDEMLLNKLAYDGEGVLYATFSVSGSGRLCSFDVTDFSNPTMLDSVSITRTAQAFGLLDGDTLLVTYNPGSRDKCDFFDVSDPGAISLLVSRTNHHFLEDFILQGDLLYFASTFDCLYVADIKDLTDIQDIWEYAPGASIFQSLTTPEDGKTFVTGWGSGYGDEVFYFHTTESGGIYTDDSTRLSLQSGWSGFDILRQGNLLAVIKMDSVVFYDVSQLPIFEYLGSVIITTPGEVGGPTRLFAEGDELYVSWGPQGVSSVGEPGGMTVLDLADPAEPTVITQDSLPGRCNAIWVKDSVVYVTGQDSVEISEGYLQIHRFLGDEFDELASMKLSTPGLGLCLAKNKLYVSRQDALEIYDVSDPTSPVLLGNTTQQMLEGRNDDVIVVANRVYVASDYELLAFDISDPAVPRFVGYYSLPPNSSWYGYRQRFRAEESYLYWATVGLGFCVIEPYGDAAAVAETSPLSTTSDIKLSVMPTIGQTQTIRYSLPLACDMELSVYDPLGCKVKVLYQGHALSGTYQLTWDASFVPAGVYFVRLSAAGKVCTERLLILK